MLKLKVCKRWEGGRGSEVYSGLLGGVFNMEINNVTEMGSSTLSKGLGTVWGWGTHLVAFCISKNFLLDLKFIEGDEKCSDPLTRPPFSLSLSLSCLCYLLFFSLKPQDKPPFLLALPGPQHFQTLFFSSLLLNFLLSSPPFSFALTELFKDFNTYTLLAVAEGVTV